MSTNNHPPLQVERHYVEDDEALLDALVYCILRSWQKEDKVKREREQALATEQREWKRRLREMRDKP